MATVMLRTSVLAALIAFAGCSLPPLQPRAPTDPVVSGSSARAQRPALGRKVVVDKRDLNILIARDASTCTVAPEVFRTTEVGDRVVCLWRT
jgi:hypothetical protein